MPAASIQPGDRVYYDKDAWIVRHIIGSEVVLAREGDDRVVVASIYSVARAPARG